MDTFARLLWTVVSAFLFSGQKLSVVYDTGGEVLLEREDRASLKLTEVAGRINGRNLPQQSLDKFAAAFADRSTVIRIRRASTIEEIADGCPVAAVHEYKELSAQVTEGSQRVQTKGRLHGRVIRLSLGPNKEVLAEIADGGQAVEPVFLQDHQINYAAEAYMPDEPVSQGDSWEVVDRRILKSGWLGTAPRLFDEAQRTREEGLEALLWESAAMKATIRWESTIERDGLRCAVLVLDLALSFSSDDIAPEFLGPGILDLGGRASVSADGRARATDRIWFGLDEGRPIAQKWELQGDMRVRAEFDVNDSEIDLECVLTLKGEGEAEWTRH